MRGEALRIVYAKDLKEGDIIQGPEYLGWDVFDVNVVDDEVRVSATFAGFNLIAKPLYEGQRLFACLFYKKGKKVVVWTRYKNIKFLRETITRTMNY